MGMAMASDPDSMHDLLRRRARDLGKSVASLAAEAGLARTYLYKLASGGTADPSVRTLVRLAAAMQVAPVALIRRYADLGMGGQPSGLPTSGTTLAHAPGNAGDRIVCNGDVTVPDHSVVKGGEAFRKVSAALEKFAAAAGIRVTAVVPVSALRGDWK